MDSPVLNSWKEIAEYVGRGVRTVQRWERELGLPVRRPRQHVRSPVVAIPAELDEWLLRGRTVRSRPTMPSNCEHGSVLAKSKELRARLKVLSAEVGKATAAFVRTTQLIAQLGQNRAASQPGNRVRGYTSTPADEPTRKRPAPKVVEQRRNKRASA